MPDRTTPNQRASLRGNTNRARNQFQHTMTQPPKPSEMEAVIDERTGEIEIELTVDPSPPAGSAECPAHVPIIPIRGAVLFPGTILPLTIGRTSSKTLLEELTGDNPWVGLFTQAKDVPNEPGVGDLHAIGVSGTILRQIKQSEDSVVAIVSIHERLRLKESVVSDPEVPYLRASVENLKSGITPKETNEWTAAIAQLRESALQLIKHKDDVPDQVAVFLRNIDDPGRLADFIASGLELPAVEKQALLEQLNVHKRVKAVQLAVAKQLHIAELQAKIQKDVSASFGTMQRRAYLTEQLKAIQNELRDGEESPTTEVDRLRKKLDEAQLPQTAKDQAARELKRLDTVPPASAECAVIVTYLDTLGDLPWAKATEDNLDLKQARAVLDHDHYGLEKVKRRLIEALAVRKLNPSGKSPILCLVGPPGVGKTSLGQSIARALNRKFARIALGGVRDEADIRGHRRTYIGAMPGRLMEEVRKSRANNPVILLDEIDKLGRDQRGDPSSALLEVLDPAQNHTFTDHYLDTPFDLSKALFIATANRLDSIPGPLLDRLEIIEVTSYTEREKKAIATKYLVPRQRKEHGLTPAQFKINAASIDTVIQFYTREAGVRELERQLAALARHTAAQVAAEESQGDSFTPALVETVLGPRKYLHEEANAAPRPGIVTGLAWTSVGGEILHIEALRYPGTNQVKLTGQLGDVMKESIAAATSLMRSRAVELNIAPETFKETDVHIHIPAGAVPKDGPSAGAAMFTALASLFTDRPVRSDIAMTGEISLRGLVLPIGGLKEKSLAALRAGIHTILIPQANEKDLPEIPAEARKQLKFISVSTVDDVLNHVLVKPTPEKAPSVVRAKSGSAKAGPAKPGPRSSGSVRSR
jgi:ATP-dependent Lon protease